MRGKDAVCTGLCLLELPMDEGRKKRRWLCTDTRKTARRRLGPKREAKGGFGGCLARTGLAKLVQTGP